MVDWSQVKWFKREEFACRCCGRADVQPALIFALDELRERYAKPIRISSGFRCSTHNQNVSNTGASGPHTTGLAADLLVSGRDAYVILWLALQLGFTGIGVSQKGVYTSRFIHLDMIPDQASHQRPWIWTY